MSHFSVFYLMGLCLTVFSLFVLWVWTGPVGVIVAAALTHTLLRLCEGRRDGQMALARKTRDAELHSAFRR